MAKLIITRGLPASGKTTWANQWVGSMPEHRTRISRDDIRRNLLNMTEGIGTPAQESMVTEVQRAMVQSFLLKGWDVCVDDTNLKLKTARDWADLAELCRARFEVVDFDHITVDVCVARDVARGLEGKRWVGSDVITKMHDRYLRGKVLPKVEPTAKLPVRMYEPNPDLPPAWIFDIDGTLANMGERSPYEWHKVGLDTCNDWVRTILHALAPTAAIIIMSGRDSACRALTETWLRTNDIPYSELHMRAQNDNRKDSIIKAELFWDNVGEKYNVLGVFDDRDQVVVGWREMGLKVAQVAPGAF